MQCADQQLVFACLKLLSTMRILQSMETKLGLEVNAAKFPTGFLGDVIFP